MHTQAIFPRHWFGDGDAWSDSSSEDSITDASPAVSSATVTSSLNDRDQTPFTSDSDTEAMALDEDRHAGSGSTTEHVRSSHNSFDFVVDTFNRLTVEADMKAKIQPTPTTLKKPPTAARSQVLCALRSRLDGVAVNPSFAVEDIELSELVFNASNASKGKRAVAQDVLRSPPACHLR